MLVLPQDKVAETVIEAEMVRVVVLVMEMIVLDSRSAARGESVMGVHKSLPLSALQWIFKVQGSVVDSQTEIATGIALTGCGWTQVAVNQHIEEYPSADHAERLV